MIKIPCLFVREFHGRGQFTITPEVTPGCEWVLAGEGIATRKWDGTACLVSGGKLFARYDAKKGKAAPAGSIPCGEPDPVTGHWPHWIPVDDSPQFRWHREAFAALRAEQSGAYLGDTYELCGPNVNGNAEHLAAHLLIRHGVDLLDTPRDFDGLRKWLAEHQIEGIVFHHADGRMVKIRRDDFGFAWPVV